jgi:chromosomal replication initiator protein
VDSPSPDALCLIRDRVAKRIGNNRFETWFGDAAEFHLKEKRLAIVVGNEYVGKWIASNHLNDLTEAVRETLGDDCHVDIQICRAAGPSHSSNGGAARSASVPATVRVERSRPAPQPRLDADFALRGKLESFVVGPSNRLAHAAVTQVIESPGSAFKLLVLHGGSGLGKTHLLQAVCNGVRSKHPQLTWRYLSGEEFTNEFVSAIRSGRHDLFRARFRKVDILIVDDIHFLARKPATQDEFLHTFNAIDAAGKTVVLSSDRHPRSITSLTEPLTDRLISGMVVEIQPPDLITRREILRRRAVNMACPIPETVLDFVAHQITRNVRELEGALFRLAAIATLTHEPLTPDLVRLVLDDQLTRARSAPEAADIERAVVSYFGVTRAQMHSTSRSRSASLARGVAMYLIRKHTPLSFPEIGRCLGGKNHSTVLMATQRITRFLAQDHKVAWTNAEGVHSAPLRDVLGAIENELVRAR